MTIETKLTETDLTIYIAGKFDFSILREFRKSYHIDSTKPLKVTVDLARTSMIDSSALGMMLNMQRDLKKVNGKISIINSNPDILHVFAITHFEKFFNIGK